MTDARGEARRLACYGWVDEGAGSVAGANYLLLRELLGRRIEVDFFANEGHVPRPKGIGGDFRYFGFDAPRGLDLLYRISPWLHRIGGLLFAPVVSRAWRRVFQPAAQAEHRRRPYDALLSLGTIPAFTIRGVPTVTWLQGPLQTELEAIRRLGPRISTVSGRRFYLALVAYYRFRGFLERDVLRSSDHVICGSRWAREALIQQGVPSGRVHALPYPIDLDLFSPGEETQIDWDSPVLLSLGRLDPRKRLDLLLDAFALVLRTFPGARLLIVGSPGYAPNQLSLLERFPHRTRVDYRPAVPKSEVPALIREAVLLVQASENENFGSAVAEALACGVPVVVGPSNGTADYLDGTSRVFEAYTPESVANAIERTIALLREEPERVRHTTRATAERWFSPPVVADRLLEIVAGAMHDRPTRHTLTR